MLEKQGRMSVISFLTVTERVPRRKEGMGYSMMQQQGGKFLRRGQELSTRDVSFWYMHR